MDLQVDLSAGRGDEDTHICPRRENNSFAPKRPEVLHCYGVDFLATKEVLEVFNAWQPAEVEWLDDSSCNVVFGSEETAQQVVQELALSAQLTANDDPWTRTKPLSVGRQQELKTGKPRRGAALRQFCLQLRTANEADRKDPTHSGHTDSVYYAHVKEQQALQAQERQARQANNEMRRLKKRQRQYRIPPKEESTVQAASGTQSGEANSASLPSTAEPDSEMTSATPAPSAAALSARLGTRGLLDPLLFMRAPAAVNPDSDAQCDSANTTDRKDDDLRSALKRAEAEYAAVLPACSASASSATSATANAKRGRDSRTCERTPGRGQVRAGTPGRGQVRAAATDQRGKKRRPVEQEPREVTERAAPQRKPELFPEVDSFLRQHKVQCRRYVLQRTFRGIKFGQQQTERKRAEKEKQKLEACSQAAQPQADANSKADSQAMEVSVAPVSKDAVKGKTAQEELPPWEQYLKVNSFFASRGQFVHTVAWQAEDRRVLTVIPHPLRTDVDVLARAVQKPAKAIRQCKLKDIAKDTGLPVFVCLPIGHPKDSKDRPPILLVDSSVMEMKRPLLFDCGSTGLCIPVSEFLRATGASCVEGLAVAAKPKVPVPEPSVTSPEPAPEPAP
eukprot:TRINITY_DN19153_c0_g1_i1.p1 TRINITY_DN19153_c0_g1~~TRINITY_DN19153_c0_g1_i1.p1  ORF type:complete len:620 (-),score=114.13 TRINITY_DN19153_c0_g1_i1:314-2173(-)